jgi:hypothetical protein
LVSFFEAHEPGSDTYSTTIRSLGRNKLGRKEDQSPKIAGREYVDV